MTAEALGRRLLDVRHALRRQRTELDRSASSFTRLVAERRLLALEESERGLVRRLIAAAVVAEAQMGEV